MIKLSTQTRERLTTAMTTVAKLMGPESQDKQSGQNIFSDIFDQEEPFRMHHRSSIDQCGIMELSKFTAACFTQGIDCCTINLMP